MSTKREFGDYQTPREFAESICMHLAQDRGIKPSVVLEPSCGAGSFIKASLSSGARKVYGIEISGVYCDICRKDLPGDCVEIINEDFFTCSLDGLERPQLVIGNPPWVNSSTLSVLGTESKVPKSNFKGARGIEAMTGSGDFDICEAFILRIIEEFRSSGTAVAMLCKTSVARDVFLELVRRGVSFRYCHQIAVDAMKVFGVNVSACLLLIQLSKDECHPDTCSVYSYEDWARPVAVYRYRDGRLYNASLAGTDYDGHCCFVWRQGVKHDCSSVMELTITEDGQYMNGAGEKVCLEPDLVYPLVKSSMCRKPVISEYSKYVLVTQRRVREDTSFIHELYPKTWQYLETHKSLFAARQSSIYKGAPEYAMFGVGDYSFSRYKVCVSGFYKEPRFCVLYSMDGRPVMTDDTCYFICFSSYSLAYTAMLYLNSAKVQAFLKAISFADSKRPYTKKVLERLDFSRICADVSNDALKETELQLGLPAYLTQEMSDSFQTLICGAEPADAAVKSQ